jgi:hypothetical protein
LSRPHQRHNGIFEKTLLQRLKIGRPRDVHIRDILTAVLRFLRNFCLRVTRAAGQQSAGVDAHSITAKSVKGVRQTRIRLRSRPVRPVPGFAPATRRSVACDRRARVCICIDAGTQGDDALGGRVTWHFMRG